MFGSAVGDPREDARLPLYVWDEVGGDHCEGHKGANEGKESQKWKFVQKENRTMSLVGGDGDMQEDGSEEGCVGSQRGMIVREERDKMGRGLAPLK